MASRPIKKRKLTPPQSEDEGDSRSGGKIQRSFFQNAAKWDLLEDQYKARKGKKKEKENTRLPVKRDGRVQAVSAPVEYLKESDDDWLEDEGDREAEDDEPEEQMPPEEPAIPVKQQIRNAKEELAKLATVLNEEPYENAGAFKALTRIGESKIPAIITLSLVTRMAIYKDLIPGYRIRPIVEDGPRGEKLSKEVRAIRTFEQAMVTGYQTYVKELARYAKARRGEASADAIASVAITCASSLLTTHPHFNFRSDLINILVWKLSSRRTDKDFEKAISTLITLFVEDDEGRPSFEAVSTLCRMMKSKDYFVHETVVNLFLHLRLLSEFSGKASNEAVDLPMESRKKQKREFRTKRERKKLKEERALQKDMDQADANVLHDERDRMQSECLKAVFATYFRILKLRTPHLMGAVLEGLAKFSHLINQQFFGDLLEALKDLIRHSESDENPSEDPEAAAEEDDDDEETTRNSTREALLCTATAFTLLAGQDAHNAKADLHLDLSFFTTHLWQTLLPISQNADLELGARSLHLPDPDAPGSAASKLRTDTRGNKVNLQTTTVLLVRCLTAVLLPPWNIRSTPPLRLAAFAKQLMSTSLHVPEKSAQALLALLADVGNTHGRKIAALWNTEERKGDGVFNALARSEEGSNPYATTVWEGELLRRHYCPKVRDAVKIMEKNIMSER
ncbi:nucleolar complex-associated protein-domain-containing protein [Nemania diffusa]|nr:nucleolar complex-associated protein-domain-containing protein [Nemania diffusa]